MLRSITFNITEAVESYNIMMQQDERSTLVTMYTQEEIEQYILKEVRRQLRWPTTAPATIADVEFVPIQLGTIIVQYELYGIFTNGKRTPLFKYYTDELSFTKDEFIGKTIAEAQRLFYDKDTAYLRGEVGGVHA